jgi:mRNA-degrading endonuclease toxin of MazEF toxin-antitoxin module
MSLQFRQWDIVRVKINPDRDLDTHPAVVISPDEVCTDQRQLRVNVLFGTKKPPAATKRPYGVLLNSADGLEHLTEIDCGFVHVISKEKIAAPAGRVAPVRQREIMRKVVECLRFRV